MADDIQRVDNTADIKHGTILVNIPGTGSQTVDTYVKTYPEIDDIKDKYQNRFDDVGYYVTPTG